MDEKVLFVLWIIGFSLTQTFSYFIGYKYAGWKPGESSVAIAGLMSFVFWLIVTINLWPF